MRTIACALVGFALAAPAAGMTAAELAPLWVEPKDLATRDLLHGPGGRDGAPQPGAAYRFVSEDTSGHSPGYKVVGPDGRRWKIKLGDEVGSEIAASRLLWAIGYHQPALYYVRDWTLTGGPKAPAAPGRFRLESDHDSKGEWAFDDNPFVGTRELKGLVVANLLINNWDLAKSNNRIYQVKPKQKGARRLYVAQDLGGAFGKTWLPIGTRNDIEDFESQEFIRGVEEGKIDFDYHGRHKGLLKEIAPEDVAWVSGLLARLSDAQLSDAFRAAGYQDALRERFVRKLKDKIRQGVALGGR